MSASPSGSMSETLPSFGGVGMTERDVARFWSKVDRSGGACACWLWLRGVDKDGYGKFQIGPNGGQVHLRAHRVALALSGKALGPVTLHGCDTPRCCNPAHLSSGTQADNRADCTRKGRNATGERSGRRRHPETVPRGERHPAAVLTNEQAEDIRRRYVRRANAGALAAEFGVSRDVIYRVGAGRSYAA